MKDETPFAAGRLVDIGRAHVWVHDDGAAGEALLLLGGLSPGHFHFDFARAHLRRFRLLTWEPCGFGPSSCPDPTASPYSATSWAADLHDVLVALGVDRTHIWANGFSTYIALRFAADHPEMVGALVTYTDVWAGDPAKGYAQAWNVYRAIIESYGVDGYGAQLLSRIYAVTDPPWFCDWFASACARVMHAETAAATGYCLTEADVRGDLRRVRAPTMALLGDRDWNGAPLGENEDPSLDLMRARIPALEVAVVGAHPIHLIVQRPREAAAAVTAFIDRSGAM